MTTVPGVRFLPNAITVLAFSAGLSSVYFATQAKAGVTPWLVAVGALGAAAILDSLDGPAARLLRSTSRIGAELDSLSDLVSFGVAPALINFIWLFQSPRSFGWVFCLLYAVCVALRLARFNSLLDDEPKPWAKSFFTGVPSPAAGLLALVPLLLSNRYHSVYLFRAGWFVCLWMALIGFLAISRVPSIALKSVRVAPTVVVPLMILLVVAVAALFYEPELITCIGLGAYLLHLPYAGWKYLHVKHNPDLWPVPGGRVSRRGSGRRVRLSVRMPRRQRVAGRLPDGSPLPVERRRGSSGPARGRIAGRRRLR